jgi:hypothetical protein
LQLESFRGLMYWQIHHVKWDIVIYCAFECTNSSRDLAVDVLSIVPIWVGHCTLSCASSSSRVSF